jgi:hypothetical protein
MIRFALASSAIVLLAPFLTAQRGPLPGMPMVPPPVPHPALAAQPLFGDSGGGSAPAPAPAPAPTRAAPAMPGGGGCAQPAGDPDTTGVKLEGKGLKKAVAKVKALAWHESLLDARAMSAATGKPILWLQALGDIDGFA